MSYFPKASNSSQESDWISHSKGAEGNVGSAITAGQIIPDVSLESLLAVITLLDTGYGILQVRSVYHSWNILVQQGNLVLIDEEGQLVAALVRKLQVHKAKHINLLELSKISSDELLIYQKVSQLFEEEPEISRQILKEIILENLLALYLENKFSIVWKPITALALLKLPIWQLGLLQEAVQRAVEQWHKFNYVHHPYQKVQLLDDEDTLAHVPLFSKVTRGQHRITEIADKFKQPILRTALHLDKLAEKRTVAILPLSSVHNDENKSNALQPKNESINEIPKIFVVDDSPVLVKQFGELLKKWGYQVNVSHDAINATQKIVDCQPNAIFLDINMPGLNGFELIKKIRRQPSLNAVPIVLVTAENNMANNFRAKWAHCRFIAKPRAPEETQEFREQLRIILREIAPLPSDALI